MAKVIKLVTKNQKINIKQQNSSVKIVKKTPRVVIKQSGTRGRDGVQGPAGVGLPAGGTTGQIITKQSNTDYDMGFTDPSDLADKNFVQNFTVASSVTVNHNLNKYPTVTVINSAGDEVIGEVHYISTSELIVSFGNPFSGRVTCN